MHIEGHVENGQIVLDTPTDLPEGTRVKVEVMTELDRVKLWIEEAKSQPDTGQTFAERYAAFIGSVAGLPKDFAERHDYYIHGTGE